jgi:hypothetical protein
MSLMQPQAEVNSEYQQARDRPLRIGGAAQEVIQTPKPELESCAKNSVTTNGAAIKPTLLNKPREVRSVNDRRVFSVSSGSSAWVPQAQLICLTGRQVRLRRALIGQRLRRRLVVARGSAMTSDEIEEIVRDLIEEHLADDDAKAALKWLDKRVGYGLDTARA